MQDTNPNPTEKPPVYLLADKEMSFIINHAPEDFEFGKRVLSRVMRLLYIGEEHTGPDLDNAKRYTREEIVERAAEIHGKYDILYLNEINQFQPDTKFDLEIAMIMMEKKT